MLNISSVGGLETNPMLGVYDVTKAALIHMTKQLAAELAPGVRVNAICPGLIKTEVAKNKVIAERETELVEGIAAKRVGTPADVAAIVGFLCLSEPCFITGQDVVVDGFQWNR